MGSYELEGGVFGSLGLWARCRELVRSNTNRVLWLVEILSVKARFCPTRQISPAR